MQQTVFGSLAFVTLCLSWASAQERARPPESVSPEVLSEKKIVFRIHAPKAESVRLVGSDLPNNARGTDLKKAANGVWETIIGPVPAGAYRYHFSVDAVAVIDPRNPETSESNSNTWSLVYVPGSVWFDTKEVPHGAVAKVTYFSGALKRFRRMHVYTPPGYDHGTSTYPVLYLLHGASDCDASWSTVGRAGFILDNLIAAGKAKAMIVVMPAGHTGPFRFGPPGDRTFEQQMNAFGEDFAKDIRPYVEKNYRVNRGRAQRALAGLSMGGAQALNIAFANLEDYGYIGVFSSGIFGIAGGFGGAPNTNWQTSHQATLDNLELKKGLRFFWFGCGKEDFLLQTNNATIAMFKKHKFDVVAQETGGGHTWLNWREYLHTFASQLFTER